MEHIEYKQTSKSNKKQNEFQDTIKNGKFLDVHLSRKLQVTYKFLGQFIEVLKNRFNTVNEIINTATDEHFMNEIEKNQIPLHLVELILLDILIYSELLDEEILNSVKPIVKILFKKIRGKYMIKLLFKFDINEIHQIFINKKIECLFNQIYQKINQICQKVKDHKISEELILITIAKYLVDCDDKIFCVYYDGEIPIQLLKASNHLLHTINSNIEPLVDKDDFYVILKQDSFIFKNIWNINERINYILELQYISHQQSCNILERIFIGEHADVKIIYRHLEYDHQLIFHFKNGYFNISLFYDKKIVKKIEDKNHSISTPIYKTFNNKHALIYYLYLFLQHYKSTCENSNLLEEYEKIEQIYNEVIKEHTKRKEKINAREQEKMIKFQKEQEEKMIKFQKEEQERLEQEEQTVVLDEKIVEINKKICKLKKITKRSLALEIEIKALTTEVEMLENKKLKNEKKEEIQAIQQGIKVLNEEIEKLEKQIEKSADLYEEIQRFQQQIKESEERIYILTKEIKELEEIIQMLNKDIKEKYNI